MNFLRNLIQKFSSKPTGNGVTYVWTGSTACSPLRFMMDTKSSSLETLLEKSPFTTGKGLSLLPANGKRWKDVLNSLLDTMEPTTFKPDISPLKGGGSLRQRYGDSPLKTQSKNWMFYSTVRCKCGHAHTCPMVSTFPEGLIRLSSALTTPLNTDTPTKKKTTKKSSSRSSRKSSTTWTSRRRISRHLATGSSQKKRTRKSR